MQSAAFKSYTKGGEDVFNPTSEESSKSDSLPDTDDESQGSESDTKSKKSSGEDDYLKSTTNCRMEYHKDSSKDSKDIDEDAAN